MRDRGHDDHGQLLGIIRPDLPNWNQQGFLVWDPKQMLTPVGIADPALFAAGLAKTVQSAGDHGCGFEASLEGWYRFLVDPEPPLAVAVPAGRKVAEVQGVSADCARTARSLPTLRFACSASSCSRTKTTARFIDDGYGWLVARVAADVPLDVGVRRQPERHVLSIVRRDDAACRLPSARYRLGVREGHHFDGGRG